MLFSLFEWLDESGRDLGETYEERLRMLEYADNAGFYCYHLAEHHNTELSTVPSPNLFLSAVAQRTRRIRLGPLSYVLPAYNPLRLLEEICMLDQLSNGRLELGVSRGSSPHEGLIFGVARDDSRGLYEESLDIIIAGLTTGELSYHGKYFQYEGTRTRLHPRQRPYPPLWYPTSNPESIAYAAAHGFHTIVSPGISPTYVEMLQHYRAEYEAHRHDPHRLNGHVEQPHVGISAQVHVAETDALARAQAKPAYELFWHNFTERYVRVGAAERFIGRGDFDTDIERGGLVVGSPETVRRNLAPKLARAHANYFLGSFSWGSLTLDQILSSLDLFTREVMPALSESAVAPQPSPRGLE
jgi:alkanesulfonate monooxygenase SsuD/methylene tetrahydromethanopterin reductase-like flavin-dependent oxidoreductase (luciferase family)